MFGKIIDVYVKSGDKVRAGDFLFILGAMRIQNEIMAPHNGEIIDVKVYYGFQVRPGDVTITID